jgi:dipeptidyl aminopeptidase/acylaminoacyl peptidase
MKRHYLPLAALLLISCSLLAVPPAALPQATVILPTATVVTATPLPTPTLTPFEGYTIDYLRKRTYGSGTIQVLEKLAENDSFTSYSIRYPSEGLNIYGFMNVPKGQGPFPVIVSIHGYAGYGKYDPFNPAQDSADFLAENQFIVLHPGLRNHPPSDNGDNLLRVGMTLDVMNLIALVKAQNDLPPELASADTDRIGLWGMSMGGEIGLRLITISPDVKAAVLYAPLSGNHERNSRQLYEITRDEEFAKDFTIPLEVLDRTSPVYYYHEITSAVQIHHGTADSTAPISWAVETCDFLKAAAIPVECLFYQDAGHVFSGERLQQLRQNALEFYRTHLLP